MRTSLALFASAMLAAASLVLADEGWHSHYSSDCDQTTYWAPPPPPPPTPTATVTASLIPWPPSIYPIYTPTPIPASSVYSYPESIISFITASYTYCSVNCVGPPTLITSTTSPTCTNVPPWNPWNSTLTATATGSLIPLPPPGVTSYPTVPPSPTPTPPASTGGAAPMGVGFTAGIVGAVGALFALL